MITVLARARRLPSWSIVARMRMSGAGTSSSKTGSQEEVSDLYKNAKSQVKEFDEDNPLYPGVNPEETYEEDIQQVFHKHASEDERINPRVSEDDNTESPDPEAP
jgi:hypothetical protein